MARSTAGSNFLSTVFEEVWIVRFLANGAFVIFSLTWSGGSYAKQMSRTTSSEEEEMSRCCEDGAHERFKVMVTCRLVTVLGQRQSLTRERTRQLSHEISREQGSCGINTTENCVLKKSPLPGSQGVRCRSNVM